MTYRVVFVGSDEAMYAWQVWPTEDSDLDPCVMGRDKAHATGEAPIVIWPGRSFHWMCPGCGVIRSGALGSAAVSGWDSPMWLLSGTPEAPSLTPSLGCAAWRNGICPDGHWWLRDGELVTV